MDKIDPQSAGRGLLVLFTALLFRMIGVVFAVSGGNLNKKEKIFMAFAWLPKAAVQVGTGDYRSKSERLFIQTAKKRNNMVMQLMGLIK